MTVSNWSQFARDVQAYVERKYWERILQTLETEAGKLGLCLQPGDDFIPPYPDLTQSELDDLQKAILRESVGFLAPYLDDYEIAAEVSECMSAGEGMSRLKETMCGLGDLGLNLARVA